MNFVNRSRTTSFLRPLASTKRNRSLCEAGKCRVNASSVSYRWLSASKTGKSSVRMPSVLTLLGRIGNADCGLGIVRLSTGTTGGPVIARPRSIIIELGLDVVSAGEVVSARAEVIPETCTPDGSVLRTSVLATWADVIMGTAAGWAIGPRIPLTGDLEVHLLGAARPGST